MTIRLILNGEAIDAGEFEVEGIPRAGDYVRVNNNATGQFIVQFAAYTFGVPVIDIHVEHTNEREVAYSARLTSIP